jgi:16S rRNA (cytosine1402-N4)-methyltransferase
MPVKHIPVLLKEVIECLNPKPGQNFIDATYGSGGHSRTILERIKPNGRLLAIDADKQSLEEFKLPLLDQDIDGQVNSKFKDKVIFINDNFVNLKKIYEQYFPHAVSGILFDLGLSTSLLEESGRGFSFKQDEALDMRFNVEAQDLTAAEVLNNYSLEDLYNIFKNFGEYPHAHHLAKGICEQRGIKKFETTRDLVEIVLKHHFPRRWQRIHPATQVFQALRIEVNNELENLAKALPQAMDILEPGGRLAVIAFHSLEDRIVKNFFRDEARGGKLKLLTKKPLRAAEQEIINNPRSRSAKLRVAEKLN